MEGELTGESVEELLNSDRRMEFERANTKRLGTDVEKISATVSYGKPVRHKAYRTGLDETRIDSDRVRQQGDEVRLQMPLTVTADIVNGDLHVQPLYSDAVFSTEYDGPADRHQLPEYLDQRFESDFAY
jgi:hypothetical protein